MRHPFTRRHEGACYFDNGVYVGDVLQDADGYYKWWPNHSGGYLDEGFLRAMADYLKDLNAEWDGIVQAELGGPGAPQAR